MIIKCPECGHQISDKAPTCPSCGVVIAGNLTKCPDCGELYLSDEGVCPHCHQPSHTHYKNAAVNMQPTDRVVDAVPIGPATGTSRSVAPLASQPGASAHGNKPGDEQPKKGGSGLKTALVVSTVIALLVAGVCFYLYQQAKERQEQEEFEIAMKSQEPLVLQGYLDTFRDAPQAHRDSIMAHLDQIKSNDKDWENALASASGTILQNYLDTHPNSPHRAVAMRMLDSIDWAYCSSLKTEEAFKEYQTKHPDGNWYADSEEAIRKLKASQITDGDRSIVANVLHNFFFSINTRDEAGLTSSVAKGLTLLDKQGASDADVVEMMNKQYKEGTTSVTWRLPGSYDIKKREIGDERYEYSTSFTASKDIEGTSGTHTKRYRISAKVNPDGKISFLTMTEQAEEKKADEGTADKAKSTEKPKTTDKPKTTEKPKAADKPKSTGQLKSVEKPLAD